MSLINNYMTDVTLGNRPGHEIYKKWGTNRAITPENSWIWPGPGKYIAWNMIAESVTIVSSSDQDGPGGSGWRKVHLIYIDNNYARKDISITLNGVTPVVISNIIHVVRLTASGSGSEVGIAQTNQGNITITGQTSGNVLGYVGQGDGSTLQLFDICPAGHHIDIYGITLNATRPIEGENALISFKLYTQDPGKGITLSRTDILDTAVTNLINIDYQAPLVIVARRRWWIQVESDQENTIVSGSLNGVLVKN